MLYEVITQSVAYLHQAVRPNHGILIHPDWVRYPLLIWFVIGTMSAQGFQDKVQKLRNNFV